MRKTLWVVAWVLFVSSCTSLPSLTPSTPTPMPSPISTALPTIAIEDLLALQVSKDMTAYPRPVCQSGTTPGKEWDVYREGLTFSLRKLFSDTRSQSLSLPSLIDIYKKGSGVTVDAFASNTGATLVSIENSNCNMRIGGGTSPTSPRDTVYVLNRQGGISQIAQVANTVQAIWSQDHWTALVTKTEWGNAQDFEVWYVRLTAGEWKTEIKLKFSQLYGDPLPRTSADGNTVTLYSLPAACNLPKNISAPYPTIESDYQLQNGEYRCVTSRIIAVPTPTRRP